MSLKPLHMEWARVGQTAQNEPCLYSSILTFAETDLVVLSCPFYQKSSESIACVAATMLFAVERHVGRVHHYLNVKHPTSKGQGRRLLTLIDVFFHLSD